MIIIIYIGLSKPFDRKLRNRIEFINEALVSACCLHLFTFTEFVNDKNRQYEMGFSMLAVMFILILINIFFVITSACKQISLIIILGYQYYKKYKDKFYWKINEPVDKKDAPIMLN